MRTECALETVPHSEGLELGGIHRVNLGKVTLEGVLRPRLVRAKGAREGEGHSALVGQVPSQRFHPHVGAIAVRALERSGRKSIPAALLPFGRR